MSANRKSTYIEAFEFQKVFLSVFPHNFLFSRKYREVLVLFSQLCHENLFENLVKYLIGMNSVEFCYLADRVLNQTNSKNFKHLENKVKIQKTELILKDFSQGVTHCSETVRNICKLQLLSINASVGQITMTQLTSILPNCSWFMLVSLKTLVKTMKIKDIYECITQHISILLQSISSHSAYSCTFFNILLKIFVSSIENNKIETPALTPKIDEGFTNEKTLRTSLENIKLRRNDKKDSVKGYSKLEKSLLELLMKCKGLDLKHALQFLLCINSKKNLIKTCLIQRAKIFDYDKKKIIECIFKLKCDDLESFEFLVTSFFEENLKSEVKKILKEIDVQKLKKMSNALIQKRVYEGILGLGYCCRYEIDNEIIEQLINFIDNSNTFISYLGISALYTIMKPIQNLKSEETKTLIIPLAEIITSRIQVIKNIQNIRIKYLKCVLTLFAFLGEYKKVAEISEEFLNIENEKNISKIYKFLSNIRINSRYLERFRRHFCEQVYGSNGKYVLKLAENNISWYSEYTATLIITDTLHRFSSKNVAKLLNR